jgi:peptidoglycan/xylan/chitin deacetylase (PgdA/CDA1 family)
MHRVRGSLARLMETVPAQRALSWIESGDRGSPGRVAVVMYHRVDEPSARSHLWPGLISTDPAGFTKQIEIIAARHVPISMSDLLEARRNSRPIPRRAVHVTFDDAYVDFAEHAWPTLRRYGVPVTLFVPTAYPDQSERGFWWDRLHVTLASTREPSLKVGTRRLGLESPRERQNAFTVLHRLIRTRSHHHAMELLEGVLRQLGENPSPSGVLGWDDLRRLAEEGVTLAAHSRQHPRLDHLPHDELEGEIVGSFRDLHAQVPAAQPVFAYPGGDYDQAAVATVGRSDIELAFTTERRAAQIGSADWLRLPRINIGQRTSVGVLRAQLGSWMRLVGR